MCTLFESVRLNYGCAHTFHKRKGIYDLRARFTEHVSVKLKYAHEKIKHESNLK